jgi:hypothetical protein
MHDGIATSHHSLEARPVANVDPFSPNLMPYTLEHVNEMATQKAAPSTGDKHPHEPLFTAGSSEADDQLAAATAS